MSVQIANIRTAYWNFLDNKLALMNPRHKFTIWAGFIVVPSVVFLFLFYAPNSKQIEKLQKDNLYLQGEIQKVEAIAGKLSEHKAERAAVELQLKAAAMLLPKQQEIPSLLTNISEQGTSSGLEFISFQPKGESRKEFYAVIPVAISVYGTYHRIGSFLDKLSKLNRIVSVNNIAFSGPQVVGNDTMLTSSMELVTYRFLSADEQKQPSAAAAPGKKKR